jgi:hypothetical protein
MMEFDLLRSFVAVAEWGAATARQHSVSRDVTLIALRERELVWQIVYKSPVLRVSAPQPWPVSRGDLAAPGTLWRRSHE